MNRRDRLKRERNEARRQLAGVEDDIAKLQAELERLEAGIEDRRETREDADDPERRREMHAAIQAKVALREAAVEKLRNRESRADKLRRSIRRFTRKIRNLGKPRITLLSLSFRSGMAGQGTIIGATGHYTAGPIDASDEDAERLWRQYHAAHLAQGWAGLGYQIGFTREGSIYLLRPFTVVGSHTLGANTGRIGCSVHGTTGDNWTPAQLRAYRYWLDHGHTSAFPASHRTPRPPRELERRVHSDFMATACPGSFESGYKNP